MKPQIGEIWMWRSKYKPYGKMIILVKKIEMGHDPFLGELLFASPSLNMTHKIQSLQLFT